MCLSLPASRFARVPSRAVKPGSTKCSQSSTLREIKLNLLLGAILASLPEFGPPCFPQSPYILRFRGRTQLESPRSLSLASVRVRLAPRGSSPRLPTLCDLEWERRCRQPPAHSLRDPKRNHTV